MKIQQVKELENGVSGITIEGRIIKTPKPPGDSEYGWSQMIILKDDTGEIGSWVNIESAEDAYKVGQYIKVQGKVSKYVKGGKPGISLNNGKVLEEIVKDEDVSQEKPTQKTTQKEYTNNDYWHDKTLRDIGNNKCIVRECAIKAATELASSGSSLIKSEKDYYKWADNVVGYIYKDQDITSEDVTKEFGGTAEEETKEERIEKAKGIVGKTEFKPASTKQKNVIFGFKDKEGFHKGMIDSRYIETHEIKEIGDPKKLSVDKASEWISFWWGEQGDPNDIGARKQREIDNPRDENGKLVNALVKGDKTSIAKDILVDKVYALRREHRLNDDVKFKKEIGYNPKIEELTEAELTKLKAILSRYVPF